MITLLENYKDRKKQKMREMNDRLFAQRREKEDVCSNHCTILSYSFVLSFSLSP
jgi:hypothetical protein